MDGVTDRVIYSTSRFFHKSYVTTMGICFHLWLPFERLVTSEFDVVQEVQGRGAGFTMLE